MTTTLLSMGRHDDAFGPRGHGNLGDRLVGFSVCLPAEPRGPVLALTAEEVTEALRHRFPLAAVVDDLRLLPASERVGLLIWDQRVVAPADRPAVLARLAPDAVVAELGGTGRLFVYPSTSHPQQLWRRGWPIGGVSGNRAALRRRIGLHTAGHRGVPRLLTTGSPFESLADRVAADLGARLDDAFTLIGVHTAGHTVLRLRGRQGDLAVRVSCTDPAADLEIGERVAEGVPGLAALIPRVVASGVTCGHPWSATPWARNRGTSRAARRRARAVIDTVTGELAAQPTGRTGPGWASEWTADVSLLSTALQAELTHSLAPLERELPTGWCHGDLWVGNLRTDRTGDRVIDWGNAHDRAPLGLDRLLVRTLGRPGTMAAALAELREDPDLEPVAGRPWLDWDLRTRAALLTAADLLYLRNRSAHDLGAPRLAAELAGLRALAAGEPQPPLDLGEETATGPGTEIDAGPGRAAARRQVGTHRVGGERSAGTAETPRAHTTRRTGGTGTGDLGSTGSGTVRGAGWLGLGAAVVKAAQTVVLLVLAALLAPSAIGVLAIGALVLNVTSALTDLGSSTALVHWRGDAERAARSALTLAVSLALTLTAAVWAIAPWLASTLHAEESGAAVIRGLMLCLPCFAVAGVSQELMRRSLAFRRRVIPDIVGALIGAGVSVGLAFGGHGVFSLVAGQLVQAVLVMVLCWAMRPVVRPGWNTQDARGLIGYGGHLAGAQIVQLLVLNVDYMIVARQLGAEPLGIYSMAFRLAYMPYLLVAVVMCGAAFAHLCRLRDAEVGAAAMGTGLTVFTVVLPLYLGMMLLAPQLELLGTTWGGGVTVLRWLAGYGLVLSMVQVCLVTLNATDRTRVTLTLNLVHLALLTGLLLWWTSGGVEMVGIAHLVAAFGMLALAVLMLRGRLAGVRLRPVRGRLLALTCGAALMSATALGLVRLMPWSRVSITGLLLVGTLTLAAYVVPVLLLDRSAIGVLGVRRTA